MAITEKIGACSALALVLLIAGGAHAVSPVLKCHEAELKAQGKLQLCLKKNAAKVLGGKPDASAKCQAKFQTALNKADQIGIAAGTTACRYLDNGDGSVSDLHTGLVWEQKGHSDGYANTSDLHDADNVYTWSTDSQDNPDGTAFTIFLNGLNGGTSPDGVATSGCFTGHCDWRLPTIQELAGILDITQGLCGGGSGPCIDPAFGPLSDYSSYTIYWWSATSLDYNGDEAWYVEFDTGFVHFDPKTLTYSVRAVRGGL